MSDPRIICHLRERRTEAGLSQSDLAERAGVSRQAVIAIEAGRQVPSTSLALHFARALRCRVEELFALPSGTLLEASLASLEGESTHSTRVAMGRVDGVWAAHAIFDDAHPGDGLIVAGGKGGDRVTIELLADVGHLEGNALVAGCAPLLGVLTGRLARRFRDTRATWVPANSDRALDLLARGLVHVAGLHLVDAHSPDGHTGIVRERFPDRSMTIVNLTRWRQGLAVAAGNPLGIREPGDVLRADVRFLRREKGAGAHKLLHRILRDAGYGNAESAEGPAASGHEEVARLVRWGAADVGVTIEAAALAQGLDFIPLSEERFDLLLPRTRSDEPPVARLLELLASPTFRSEAARLPGYDLTISGDAATVGGQAAT